MIMLPRFKGFTQEDVNIAKYMVRLQIIEAEDRTGIEVRGVKLEVSGCKKSVEKSIGKINTIESNFNEGLMKTSDLKTEIDNIKKINDDRVKRD